MFDRRLAENFDWGLLGIALALGMFGLIILYSAVTAGIPDPQKTLCVKQLIWYCAGLVAILIIIMFNYKILDQWAYAIYIGGILLLLCVMFFGKYVAGSRRWLALGPVSVQPSEMMKIGLIIVLAHYYSKNVNTKGAVIAGIDCPGPAGVASIRDHRQATGSGHGHSSYPDRRCYDGFCQNRTAILYLHRLLFHRHYSHGLVFFEGIPAATHIDFFEPGPRSFRGRLSHYSVQDSHWFRDALGQGVFEWNPECALLPA